MTKREAKQVACGRAAIALAANLNSGWDLPNEQVVVAMRELIRELANRGRLAHNPK